jgi:1-acyl-sn-glycerol-3-phosphate acyltransferase
MSDDKAALGLNLAAEASHRMDNDQTTFIRLGALVARIGSRLVARVEVEGLENVPRTGAVILAMNHISNVDSVVAGGFLTLALRRRRMHWLGKREMFDWPVLGLMAAHGGVHPVDRGAADTEAFRLAVRLLEAGYVLAVFPEGTRSLTGELQEAKDGLAMLALRTGAPVVPVGVNGTDLVWRKGKALPSPLPRRTITFRVGEPFRVADAIPADTDRRAAKALATRAVMGRIAELLDPRHRGVYADAVREDAASAS